VVEISAGFPFPEYMARKQFVVVYPDGSKKNVSGYDREQMLLAGEIRKDGERANHYRFVGPSQSFQRFHSFSELARLGPALEPQTPRKRFLSGNFVVQFGEKRHRELLETPEALAVRLPGMIDALARSDARTKACEKSL
jgi:hypothetical protein